ncbi:MAG: glycosyltransferase [Oscillospiraceae bacterium]
MLKSEDFISIIIPMYNSEKTIELVVNEIRTSLENKCKFEIILVNDYSKDNVLQVASKLAIDDARIKLIDLAKNSGQVNAMMAGYSLASGTYLVSMDDDFQHPAGAIIDLLEELINKDMDVVFAKYQEQKENAFRRFGSNLNYKMAEIMAGKPKGIRSNSFFAFRPFIKENLLKYTNGNPYLFGIIYASTDRISNIEVEHRSRAEGKSNFTLKKLISLWVNGLLSFSVKPLRMATLFGFMTACISGLIGFAMIINRLINPNVGLSGWTSIIVCIIFFSGLQLICVGILGEYLGRLYIAHSKLPNYCIRKTMNFDEKDKTNNE